MKSILVFAQQDSGKLSRSALSAITAAAELKSAWGLEQINVLVLGTGAKAATQELSTYSLGKVWYSESSIFEKYLAANFAALITELMSSHGVLVLAATSTGKDLAPRVAALIGAGQASEVIAVNSDGSLRRPIYAGNAFADVEVLTPKKVVTVRSSAFGAAVAGGGTAVIEELSVNLQPDTQASVVGYEIQKGERPELSSARAVVSGGRALQSAENFNKYLLPLADSLGAALGASRAAVDSGFVPNDWQVGQTGKVVAPDLYIAVGISGAIQHLAGMKDSKTIVAINKDGDAPIFEIADYGLVGDLYEIVPQLTTEIKKVKSA
jgi:electron transfer flavoprotein alpha subunit